MRAADYEYLKTWLSPAEINDLRSGNNPYGIVLSRRQVYNIMKNKNRNFRFRNLLVKKAMENEAINTLSTLKS